MNGKQLSKNQFELFLKEDFISFFMSPEYEKQFSPDKSRTNTAIAQLERSSKRLSSSPSRSKSKPTDMKERFIQEENNRLEEPLAMASMQTLNTHHGAWTNREEMWALEDKRLLFSTKTLNETVEWIEVIEQIMNEQLNYFWN